jgi:hypothetical protein
MLLQPSAIKFNTSAFFKTKNVALAMPNLDTITDRENFSIEKHITIELNKTSYVY